MGNGCDLEWRSVWEEARDSLGLADCGRIDPTADGGLIQELSQLVMVVGCSLAVKPGIVL